MCGRFTSLFSPELIAILRESFSLTIPDTIQSHYNVAPSQLAWVIRNEGDHNRIDLLKWGLLPFWAKSAQLGNKMINARSETISEKPTFRQALKLRRCIIPAGGFFEWSHVGGKKQPYYFHMADGSPMCMAGLWEKWQPPGEEDFLQTFTFLTTSSNELVAPLHDRQPVILNPDNYNLWLSHSMHDPEQLKDMYKPLSANLLESYKVSDQMNNVHFTEPSCIERI